MDLYTILGIVAGSVLGLVLLVLLVIFLVALVKSLGFVDCALYLFKCITTFSKPKGERKEYWSKITEEFVEQEKKENEEKKRPKKDSNDSK